MQGVHKIGAAISGPRIADKNFTDTRIFLILVGIEMSFLGYRDFLIFFSASRSSMTSNLQDVEAQKSTGWSKGEDDLDAEQQNAESRYQKEISIPKRGDFGHLDTTKKTSWYWLVTCSFCHLYFVKDIPAFWTQNLGRNRLISANLS